jgi:hypothetical protein
MVYNFAVKINYKINIEQVKWIIKHPSGKLDIDSCLQLNINPLSVAIEHNDYK